MPSTSIQFLYFYIMLIFVYGILLNAVVEHEINQENPLFQPPIPSNSTGNFFEDSGNSLDYIGEVINYYFFIFFEYDTSVAIISTIFALLSIIAVFIILTEIIFPLLDIIIPDWL